MQFRATASPEITETVQRILIVGCPASGKPTLARQLGARTGLPLVHLDRLYWRTNWTQAPQSEFCMQLDAELAKSSWIIDGNYGKTVALRLTRADTAILLDFPRRLCLWRAIRRSILEFGRARPDMADGCREKLDPAFLRFVWRFEIDDRPILLEELDRFTGEKIVLRSPDEVRRFVQKVSAASAQRRSFPAKSFATKKHGRPPWQTPKSLS